MKTAQEFKQQAETKNITEWHIHTCSLCGFHCKYVFTSNAVFYNSGCDCMRGPYNIQPRNWERVADHYNMQNQPEVIKKYNEFWGFEN